MKKLFFILLLFVSSLAVGQVADTVTVSANPVFLSVGDTDITRVDLYPPKSYPTLTLLIKMPSTNVGTVQIATESDVVSSSPAYAAGAYVWITCKDKFWIKLSAAADDIEISW